MSSATSLLQAQGSNGTAELTNELPSDVLKRRADRRRPILVVQAFGCSLVTLILLIYCYAGTIPIVIPSAYFLCGMGLIGFFVVLSESHFNDRFEDHYLTIFQIS